MRVSNDTGSTALHEAVIGSHRQVIDVLLEAGADVDAVRGDGYRRVTCALLDRDRKQGAALARMLLERGAKSNIYVAAAFGDEAFVRDALASDPSLANFEDPSHVRPLSAAARRNDLEMVTLLLKHGADPRRRSLPDRDSERRERERRPNSGEDLRR